MNRKGNRKWPSPARKGFQRNQPVRPNPLHFKGVAPKTGPKHHRHQDRNRQKDGDGQLPRQGSKRGRQACRRKGVRTGSPRTRGREGRGRQTTQQEEGGRTIEQEGDGQLPRQGSKRGRQACRRQGVQTGSPRTRERKGRRGRTTQQEEGLRTTKQEGWRTGDQTGRGGLGPDLLRGAWEGVGSLSLFGCRMQLWHSTPYGFVGRGSSVGLVV